MSHRRLALLLGLALAAAGCNAGKGNIDDDDDDGGGGVGGGGTEFDDPDNPVVTEGTITCYDSGDSAGLYFFARVLADDPQGVGDLADIGGMFRVYDLSENLLYDEAAFACEDGECTYTIQERQIAQYATVTCSQQASYIFTAAMVDETGNEGEEFTLTWVDE